MHGVFLLIELLLAWIIRPSSAVSALVLRVVSHHRGGHYDAVVPRVKKRQSSDLRPCRQHASSFRLAGSAGRLDRRQRCPVRVELLSTDSTQRRRATQRFAESTFSLRSSAFLCVSALIQMTRRRRSGWVGAGVKLESERADARGGGVEKTIIGTRAGGLG